MAATNLVGSMKGLWSSGKDSDLVILCKNEEIHVHSLILSAQSKYFKAACTGNFAESITHRIELFEDDLDLVRKMLAFCYGHDYEDSELLTKGQWILAAHTNALMYSLGDKYDVSGLRQVSSAGLERNLQCATARIVRDYPSPLSWIDGFQDLADAVYSGTPDSDDSLREPLIEFVYKQWANIGKLLPITESFAAIPQFVIDVIERHRKILNIARIECSEETRCRHTHCSTLEELKQEVADVFPYSWIPTDH